MKRKQKRKESGRTDAFLFFVCITPNPMDATRQRTEKMALIHTNANMASKRAQL